MTFVSHVPLVKTLSAIHVEGFRSIRMLDLAPGRITLLIGANGSGKSNLLSLLRMVPLLRTQSLRRFVGEAGGASALLHYGPKTTREIDLRLEFTEGEKANAYSARLGYAAADTLIFLDETVEFRPLSSAPFRSYTLGAGHSESRLSEEANEPQVKTTARTVNWWLAHMTFFHFHDTSRESPLRQNSRLEDTRFLRSDGSNLAAYLRSIVQPNPAAWARITGLVRQI